MSMCSSFLASMRLSCDEWAVTCCKSTVCAVFELHASVPLENAFAGVSKVFVLIVVEFTCKSAFTTREYDLILDQRKLLN